MNGWNLADAFETIAHRIASARRSCTTAPSPRGATSTDGRTRSRPRCSAGAASSRTRWRSTSTTGPSTSSRCSPRSRPAWSRSTPTIATRDDELAVPVGQRRRRRGGVPRRLHATVSRRCARSCPRSPRGCGSTTTADHAPTGRSPYEAAPSAAPPGGRTTAPWGRERRRPAAAVHRRHHGHAQGRDVATGRPVPRLDCERRQADAARPGPSTASPARSPSRARSTCRRRRSCTAPACSTRSPRCCSAAASSPLARASFDPVEVLDTIQTERVEVGDDRRRRLRQAARARRSTPSRSAGTSPACACVLSSWRDVAREAKDGLLRHAPHVILVDALGSSEAIGIATAVDTGGSATTSAAASFTLGPATRACITEDGRDVKWGSGERGRVAMRGFTPIGYYKDPEKSATHVRRARRRALLDPRRPRHRRRRRHGAPARPRQPVHQHRRREGVPRGGGGGAQAARRGAPMRPWWACPTTASARRSPRSSNRTPGRDVDTAALIAHVKEHLAGYKAPKRIITVSSIGRAPNGKLDYRALRALAVMPSDPSAGDPSRYLAADD